MSTKTLRKRIALAAVTALGAGLLSVVSTPAANATGTAFDNDLIEIAVNGTTGAGAASDTFGSNVSFGVITSDTSVALASTATMTASGTIVVGTTVTAASSYSVVGGTIVGASPSRITVGSSLTSANTAASGAVSIAVKPTGVGTMTIALSAGPSTAPTSLLARLIVTVVAASASGVYSAANSFVNTAVVGSSLVDGVDQVNAITGSASRIPNGAQGKINFALKDAYDVALNPSIVTATSTAGGLVNINSNGTFGAVSGTASLDVDASIASSSVTVTQAVANVPVTVTVTIAYRGVTIGTKTFSFEGEVAKVTVTPNKIGLVGSNAEAARVTYADSAGNVLYPQLVSGAVTSSVVTASMGDQTVVNGVTVSNYPAQPATTGKISVTCVAGGTVPALQIRHLNTGSGSIILSNTWSQGCSEAAASMTGSWDKASYTPGSIATLTLSFKDAKGFAANAYDLLDTITVTGSPSSTTASAGAAITPMNPHAARASGVTGTITQQYVVGSTLGNFVAVVVPAASLVTASGGTQANLSLPYTIASGTTSVTNEQVLASIVSLIASINKQIVALQKLILQRR